MLDSTVIELVAESPEAHGVFEARGEELRRVYAVAKSVGMKESYAALSAGIEPSFVFELSDYSEYHDEKLLIFRGERYRVVRSYRKGMKLELTAAKATNDRTAVIT